MIVFPLCCIGLRYWRHCFRNIDDCICRRTCASLSRAQETYVVPHCLYWFSLGNMLDFHLLANIADVVELVDTLALGASAARREGSSPFIRTNSRTQVSLGFLIGFALRLPSPCRLQSKLQRREGSRNEIYHSSLLRERLSGGVLRQRRSVR